MMRIDRADQIEPLFEIVCQPSLPFKNLVAQTIATALNAGIPLGVTHGGEHFLQKTCPPGHRPDDIDLVVPAPKFLGIMEEFFLGSALRLKLTINADGSMELPDRNFARVALTRTPCRPNDQRLLIECGDAPDKNTGKMKPVAKVDVLVNEATSQPTFDTLRGALAKLGIYHQLLPDGVKTGLAGSVSQNFWVDACSDKQLTANYLARLFLDLRTRNSPAEVYQILAETSFFQLFPLEFFLRANQVIFAFLKEPAEANQNALAAFLAEVHYTVQLSALNSGKHQQSF